MSSRKHQKHFLRRFLWPNFDLVIFYVFPNFSRKWFQLRHSKIAKKQRVSLSKWSKYSFWISRLLQNHFLQSFLYPTFNWIGFESSILLSQKTVSISSPKNALSKRSEHSFLRSRYLQSHFLRSFPWPNFDLNSFEHFASLFQKMVSTSPIKNLQKTKKMQFSNADNIEHKEASKAFS